jgi:hypothetical protein
MTTSRQRVRDAVGDRDGRQRQGTNVPTKTDSVGVLLELTSEQIQQMTREDVLDYQQRRRQQIEDNRTQANAQADLDRYKECFVEAGGRERDAEAAYYASRNEAAASAATAADTAAARDSRRRIRQGL